MSPTKSQKPRKRRNFTPEFKAEAVRPALTPGERSRCDGRGPPGR